MNGSETHTETVFRLLRHPVRRRAIAELAVRDEQLAVETLAETIVRSDTRTGQRFSVDANEPETVRLELVHTHLPKLASAGWVTYDWADETVRCAVSIDIVRAALERAIVDLQALHDELG